MIKRADSRAGVAIGCLGDMERQFRAIAAQIVTLRDARRLLHNLAALNKLQYPMTGLVAEDMTRVLSKCCMLGCGRDPETVTAFSQTVVRLLYLQKAILPAAAQERVVRHLIQLLRECQPRGEVGRAVLAALGAALFTVGADAVKYHADLLDTEAPGLLLPFASLSNTDVESRRAAIYCIGSLCALAPNKRQKAPRDGDTRLDAILQLLLDNLSTPLPESAAGRIGKVGCSPQHLLLT